MHKAISLAVTLAVAALLIIGCSGGPTVPLDDGASITPEPEGGSQRFLLGVFEIDIDAAASQLTIEPVRNASAHYDVTDYITPPQCDDCLEIEVLEFKPIDHYVKLKISIRNPTHFTVYDVRGIMISNFEGMHLLNADSYTDLWDDGGDVTINPFRAFATDWPHREILPDTGHARICEIEYPTFGDLINALLVFDASWPGNCEEPYEITNFTQEPIYDFTGSAGNIYVDVHDWQNDVNKVTLVAPEITGEPSTQFTYLSGDTWSLALTNNVGADAGDYELWIEAKSEGNNVILHDKLLVTILPYINTPPVWDDTIGIVSVIAGDEEVVVTYSTASDPQMPITYVVYYSEDTPIDFGTASTVETDIGSPTMVEGLTNEIEYHFAVRARDAWGLEEENANELPATPGYDNLPPVWDDTIGIVLTEPGYEEVTVTFGTASDPDAPVTYNVYYSETSPIDFGTAPKEVFPSSPAVIDELKNEWTYYFAVRAQDALGLEDDNIIEMAETPADPCIDDQDPPDTFIDAGCEDQYTGTTEITLTVSGSDPFDCTEESNLLFEWRKKVQGDTWSDDWSSPVLGPSLIIDGLYDAGWDIQVRAIDEVANKDEIPAECSFTIGEGGGVPDNPVDVTPPWLNFSPFDVCIDGHYAYIAGGVNGLHIFNISDPANTIWVNRVVTPGEVEGITVSSGYAYVACADSGLQIIDIDPPESAYIFNSVETPDRARGVAVSGGYAYVADGVDLQIIDIDPPESAYIVNSVDTPGLAIDVVVSDGYAYVADRSAGLQIIDIDPPESAYIVNAVDKPDRAYGVAVSGGYAYVADWRAGLQIIDIDPPESAYIVNAIDTPGNAYGVAVSGGYAYVADGSSGLRIIDIDPPESAYIVNYVDTPGAAYGVAFSSGYAYVADYHAGLQIIDIDPPESAYIVKGVDTPDWAFGVAVSGGYAYVADWEGGLQIIDIAPPESAYIVNAVDTPGNAYGVAVSGGYAYVAAGYAGGLQIIDIDPPESAYIVNAVDTPDQAIGVAVSGGYAYVADGDAGLQIIDIDPPESAYIFNSVETPDRARGVVVSGGYAYVAAGDLQIIDIDPPESAYIFNSVNTPGVALGVAVSSGYAYVAAAYASGLQIIDIDPPESAYIISAVDMPGVAYDVAVSGGYAYVADEYGGLRIIKLW